MKAIFTISFIIIFSLAFTGCSDEDDWQKIENLEHKVTIKLFSNTPGVPMTLVDGLVVKDYWEYEAITKNFYVNFIAYCDEPTVLMTAEIYVNGKLKASNQGNQRVEVGFRLKGDGY